MTRIRKKVDFPVERVRHFLEPGPVVLVSSRWKEETNLMTMGWHTVMEFSPSLVGCVIAAGNHSFELVRKSAKCVINLPTADLTDIVVRIGNSSGSEIDKFREYGLTAVEAEKVGAPLVAECHANFECRIYDDALVKKYNFFIFEVVKAHAAVTPKNPEMLYYLGDGAFRLTGKAIQRRRLFRPEMLQGAHSRLPTSNASGRRSAGRTGRWRRC